MKSSLQPQPESGEEYLPAHGPFYPPRARWYARGWYWGHRVKRALVGEWTFSHGLDTRAVIWSLLVPGYIFHATGFPRTARIVWSIYGASMLVFLARLGHTSSDAGYMFMLSAHATSLAQLVTQALDVRRMRMRIVIALASVFCAAVLLYLPARSWLLQHVAMPMNVGGTVIVVRPTISPATLKPGDVVAFEIIAANEEGARRQAGFGLDKVLALPGDEISFARGVFIVNGQAHAAPPYMPDKGTLRLREKEWFIWPGSFKISFNGANGREGAVALRLSAARVPEERLVGRPYRWWFGRAQKQL